MTERSLPPKPPAPPASEQDFSDVTDGFAPGDPTDPDVIPMDFRNVRTDSIEEAIRSALASK